MKKFLKLVGSILALPFNIVISLVKIILIPLVIIQALLLGKLDVLKEKIKFADEMMKFCMKHLKEGKPFYFGVAQTYGAINDNHSLIQCNYYDDGKVIHSINTVHGEFEEQKSEECN